MQSRYLPELARAGQTRKRSCRRTYRNARELCLLGAEVRSGRDERFLGKEDKSMSTKPSMMLWSAHASKTKQLKACPSELEHDISQIIETPRWLQFCRDCRTYSFYEAVVLLDEDAFTEVVLTIAKRYKWTLAPTSIPLPVGQAFETTTTQARDVSAPRVPITPAVSWGIRKDLIVERAHLMLMAATPNHPDPAARHRTKLDRLIRRAVKQPHLHAEIIDAMTSSLWDGVQKVPADIRQPVMAQIMTELDIPPAIDAYADHKPKIPKASVKPRPDRVVVTDVAGNAWTWNMGWFRIGEDGERIDTKPPLGHATFRRSIKPATLEQLGKTSFRHTRPWGHWRRGSGPADHPLFGSCEIVITDGVHAVIKLVDGTKREVVLDTLRSIGTALPRQASSTTTSPKSPRTPRTPSPKAAAGLDFLMSLLTNEVK